MGPFSQPDKRRTYTHFPNKEVNIGLEGIRCDGAITKGGRRCIRDKNTHTCALRYVRLMHRHTTY